MFFIQKRSAEQQFTETPSIEIGKHIYLGLVFDGQYCRAHCQIKYLNKSKTEGFVTILTIDNIGVAYFQCEPKLQESIHFNVMDIEVVVV